MVPVNGLSDPRHLGLSDNSNTRTLLCIEPANLLIGLWHSSVSKENPN